MIVGSQGSRGPRSVDVGLAALTLLVAESDPANKETMIRLIMNTLANDFSST
ncbi:hypothetical protein [Salinicola halimionae]|uniref:hypothetical protein n=1 Tax=Salinicola halimionae TaxID=1949081 RepID=UPI001300AFEB|nr:hypothetical protein [Salinicola halimionae]